MTPAIIELNPRNCYVQAKIYIMAALPVPKVSSTEVAVPAFTEWIVGPARYEGSDDIVTEFFPPELWAWIETPCDCHIHAWKTSPAGNQHDGSYNTPIETSHESRWECHVEECEDAHYMQFSDEGIWISMKGTKTLAELTPLVNSWYMHAHPRVCYDQIASLVAGCKRIPLLWFTDMFDVLDAQEQIESYRLYYANINSPWVILAEELNIISDLPNGQYPEKAIAAVAYGVASPSETRPGEFDPDSIAEDLMEYLVSCDTEVVPYRK